MGFTALTKILHLFEPIVNQRWAKTGVPGEKTPALPVQNLASHTCPERGAVRDPMFKSQSLRLLTTGPWRPIT